MIDITQTEVDSLLELGKRAKSNTAWLLPNETGGRLKIELESLDKKEEFILDISRSAIKLEKGTYQTRARQIVTLARLDFGGPPHTNPDGEEVGVPHIHFYKEGYADKFAFPLPNKWFSGSTDRHVLLDEFMKLCRIIDPPVFNRGLF
jgi:hypothetical protein